MVTPFLMGQICLLSWIGNSIPCRLNKINQAYFGNDNFSPDMATPQLTAAQELINAAFADTQRGGCFGGGHDVRIILKHMHLPLKRLIAAGQQHINRTTVDTTEESAVGLRLR